MKLIIGLGNPGEKYKNNRHNVGHMFIDYVLNELRVASNEFKFLKTDSFMNQSGAEVRKLSAYYKLTTDDLIVVHDDLDIPFEKFKIQKSGGPKLHNGITSIEKGLRTKEFWRVRIGIDNLSTRIRQTHSGSGQVRIDGETYVLQDFTQQEKENLSHIFNEVVDKLKIVFHNELI